jgi:hypothetical protein
MARSSISARFYYGFVTAAGVCWILGHVLLSRASGAIAREGAERSSLIAAQALSDIVERTSGSGDAVRRAAVRFAGHHPEVRAVRVVTLLGREMTASTLDERGPRALEPSERPLFEIAERLGMAVAKNRGQGVAPRAEEVAREWSDYRGDPVLTVTVPFERGGRAVGAVQVESFPALERRAEPFDLPIWIFLLLPLLIQQRRPLAIGTAILLGVFLVRQAGHAKEQIDAKREQMAERIVQTLATESERTGSLLAEIGAPAGPKLDPLSWDTDSQGRPVGLAASPGVIDPRHLAAVKEDDRHRSRRTSMTLFLLGFTILGVAGFYRMGREEPPVPE